MSTATPEDGNIAEDQAQQQGEVGDIKTNIQASIVKFQGRETCLVHS